MWKRVKSSVILEDVWTWAQGKSLNVHCLGFSGFVFQIKKFHLPQGDMYNMIHCVLFIVLESDNWKQQKSFSKSMSIN